MAINSCGIKGLGVGLRVEGLGSGGSFADVFCAVAFFVVAVLGFALVVLGFAFACAIGFDLCAVAFFAVAGFAFAFVAVVFFAVAFFATGFALAIIVFSFGSLVVFNNFGMILYFVERFFYFANAFFCFSI
jgi:hypothetical protein